MQGDRQVLKVNDAILNLMRHTNQEASQVDEGALMPSMIKTYKQKL